MFESRPGFEEATILGISEARVDYGHDMLVSVIHSGFRNTQNSRLFEATMTFKHKTLHPLIPTLPFYKLPKSVQFECSHARTFFLVSTRK